MDQQEKDKPKPPQPPEPERKPDGGVKHTIK
jgi:hypothetical protein